MMLGRFSSCHGQSSRCGQRSGNRLSKLVTTEKDDAKVVEEMFLSICAGSHGRRVGTGIKTVQGPPKSTPISCRISKLVDALAAYEKQLPAKQAAWEKSQSNLVEWTVLDPTTLFRGGASLAKKPTAHPGSGKNPNSDLYTCCQHEHGRNYGYPLGGSARPQPERPGTGSRAERQLLLNEFQVTVWPSGDPAKAKAVSLHNAKPTSLRRTTRWLAPSMASSKPAGPLCINRATPHCHL